MSAEPRLLQAIRAAPEEAAPRQVYADWLDEQGRSDVASRIREQLALGDAPEPGAWARAHAAIDADVAAFAARAGEGTAGTLAYRAGLVEAARIAEMPDGEWTVDALRAHAPTVRGVETAQVGALAPLARVFPELEALRVYWAAAGGVPMALPPGLRRVTVDTGDLALYEGVVAGLGALERLEAVTLIGGPDACSPPRPLPGLRALAVTGTADPGRLADWVGEGASLASLDWVAIDAADLAAIAALRPTRLGLMTEIALDGFVAPPTVEVLDLQQSGVHPGAPIARMLAGLPRLRELTLRGYDRAAAEGLAPLALDRLSLGYSNQEEGILTALDSLSVVPSVLVVGSYAARPLGERLGELAGRGVRHLAITGPSRGLVPALAGSGLEELHIHQIPLAEEAGLTELPALRHLTIGHSHRPYGRSLIDVLMAMPLTSLRISQAFPGQTPEREAVRRYAAGRLVEHPTLALLEAELPLGPARPELRIVSCGAWTGELALPEPWTRLDALHEALYGSTLGQLSRWFSPRA